MEDLELGGNPNYYPLNVCHVMDLSPLNMISTFCFPFLLVSWCFLGRFKQQKEERAKIALNRSTEWNSSLEFQPHNYHKWNCVKICNPSYVIWTRSWKKIKDTAQVKVILQLLPYFKIFVRIAERNFPKYKDECFNLESSAYALGIGRQATVIRNRF